MHKIACVGLGAPRCPAMFLATPSPRLFALLGLLALTGCPYTEGCESLPVAEGELDDTERRDGGAVVDASVEAGREPFVPVGPSKPNCDGLTATCNGGDCCASALVPGGSFDRSNSASFPATVSDFELDVYEVVVGRFRAFVNAGEGTRAKAPADGAGAHPKIAGSGWSSAWNTNLEADSTALVERLKCDSRFQPWTDAPGDTETRPMNCVTWFEAFAFCAWDGGWLPTEAEWNYAAAGGSEQREYPWGAGLDDDHAVYGCTATNRPGVRQCTFDDLKTVGSKSPLGDGRWGHADLAGNVWEWMLDYSEEPYRLTPCDDCAELRPSVKPSSGRDGAERAFRGGAFNWDAVYQRTAFRYSDPEAARYASIGLRCARAAR